LGDLARDAAEAALSGPRLDMLTRQAAKASGFALPIVRAAFDRASAERKARQQADPAVAAAEAAARLAAQEAARAALKAERERLRRECEPLAKDPEVLAKMEQAARRLGVVGEGSATRGAYLAASSRLLRSGAISLLRRGAPAGGKNYLFTNVTVLMPEESVITVSGASPMALIYYGDNEDALKHKIIVIAEAAAIAAKSNGDENPLTIFLRTLLSEGCIDRYVAIPQQNSLPRTVHVRRNGPVALMLTSARENIDEEMLTRLMVSDTDETVGQTVEIVRRKLGQDEKPLTLLTDGELERWRDLQRWFEFDAPYDVEIQFQGAIWAAYQELIKTSPGAVQLRMRRDISGFLAAIKASALVHRAQRKVGDGRIVAEFADYQNAWEAFDAGMASLYGLRAREEIIAVVEAAEQLGVLRCDTAYKPESVKLTAAMVRKELRINSNQTANNRIKEAVEHGALLEDDAKRGTGRGRPRYFWIVKTSAELRNGPKDEVFPSPDAVKKFLEGREGSKTNGQDGQDGRDGAPTAPDRGSYPSYPSCPFDSDSDPSPGSTNFFNGAAAPPAAAPPPMSATAPISENTPKSRRWAPPEGSTPPNVIIAAAREKGVLLVLDPDRTLFTLEWRGPFDPLIDEAILANYEAILAWLIREAERGP
jgi:multidrug efflux pump subunit AcrA (membrane-fusion protein)